MQGKWGESHKPKEELNDMTNKKNREHLLFKWPQNKPQNFQKTEQKALFNDNVKVNLLKIQKQKDFTSWKIFKHSFKQLLNQRKNRKGDRRITESDNKEAGTISSHSNTAKAVLGENA